MVELIIICGILIGCWFIAKDFGKDVEQNIKAGGWLYPNKEDKGDA